MSVTPHRPDITVIIPTYNRLWSLPQAIESCRSTSCCTEIIVVDDGSTDGTSKWLESQSDIRAFYQENSGKDWAVNRALGEARGEYIRFLDSDDYLAPLANEKQLALARNLDLDVVCAGMIIFNDENKDEIYLPWETCDDFVAQQLGGCFSSHYSAFIFRRDFMAAIPHRQEFGVRDDRMFIIEVALKSPKVGHVDFPTLYHRNHTHERLQKSEGLRRAADNYSHWMLYKRAAALLEARGEFTQRRRHAISRVLWPTAHWIAATHIEDANNLHVWLRKIDPEFSFPVSNRLLAFLYENIGFRRTERLLNLRRNIYTTLFKLTKL
jgi:glycosyltransferase involved in cell wall biosynthesis